MSLPDSRVPFPSENCRAPATRPAVRDRHAVARLSGNPYRSRSTVPEGATRLVNSCGDAGVGSRPDRRGRSPRIENAGKAIPAGRGAGACCRQPRAGERIRGVRLRRFVAVMPEPRRDGNYRTVHNVIAPLRERASETNSEAVEKPGDRKQLGLEYFGAGCLAHF